MKIIAEIGQVILILTVILLKKIFIAKTEISRKSVTKLIRRKYPAYKTVSLRMQYADWSSTVREANDENRATSAEAIIRNDEEQRTLHFRSRFRIWRITHDTPDSGKNVPDDIYFMEDNWAEAGQKIDIDESIRQSWVIPDENGNLYHRSGGENWYYSYHYIRNMYKTKNGMIYVLKRESFEWELTEKTYSEMDYYGNYTRISAKKAMELIQENKVKFGKTGGRTL